MIVNSGKNLMMNLLAGDSTSNVTHMAVGTGTTAVVATDTALETEVLRKTFQDHTNDSTNHNTVYEMWISSTEANGDTLGEVGIFNAASAGDMLCRTVLGTTIAKTSSLEVLVQYKINQG